MSGLVAQSWAPCMQHQAFSRHHRGMNTREAEESDSKMEDALLAYWRDGLHHPPCPTSDLGPADGPAHLLSQCPAHKGGTVTKGKGSVRFSAGFHPAEREGCERAAKVFAYPLVVAAAPTLPSHPAGWRRRATSWERKAGAQPLPVPSAETETQQAGRANPCLGCQT